MTAPEKLYLGRYHFFQHYINIKKQSKEMSANYSWQSGVSKTRVMKCSAKRIRQTSGK
jgi:uncharacterized protein YktA (UPF0223 family)